MPARLACVKPAASVRSEPGSNSQVGLETSNRLITTFDEVPPYLLNTFHNANNDGVTYVNVYRRSLSSGPNTCKLKFENSNLQVVETRKDSAVHVSLSSSSLVKQPGVRKPHFPLRKIVSTLIRRQITTDDYRLLIYSS